MEGRKYEVRGTDDLGDEHIFRPDDARRAEGVREAMAEDLDDVELVEKP